MASTIGNIGKVPELRKRVIFTLSMLAVYRIGVFVAVPGVDRQVVSEYLANAGGGLLGMFNMFTGGALEQVSIFALGIMPYISASIILQLLTVVVPAVERLNKEGESGRRKINQYTRYGTVLLSLIQGSFMASWLSGLNSQALGGASAAMTSGFGFFFLCVLSLTTGTVFIMWLGEQITARGIGNGISLIIYAGIVAGLPTALQQTYSLVTMGQISMPVMLMIAFTVFAVIAVIVFFERAQRRIPVQYAKRVVGNQVMQAKGSFLPLKVNTAGVIPPIFASSILMFPMTLANFAPDNQFIRGFVDALSMGSMLYNVVYVILIIFFCYFYTAVTFNPQDVADNLKKGGGFVPGVRAGSKTAEYIDTVLSRLTFGGSLYVAAVCVLPGFLQSRFSVPFYFGGTSLLIVVGVAMDTAQQIESHLITRNYDGFAGPRGPRMRGRRAAA
ncbi:MAG TPA: preprotein translocase subunit SecY [Myxococcales bacterium]|nr:preprotein translocase subunit SecY [Myxococcales bacterium]HAN32124.1 preprotein translocase subunit SecY [Myxococcales bacterium]